MVFIQPRFVTLVGLCVIASSCSAALNQECGLAVKRSESSPADSITKFLFPMDKDKDSRGKDSKDSESMDRDSTDKDPKDKESSDKSSNRRRDGSNPRVTPRIWDDTDAAPLSKRSSGSIYPRDYRPRDDWHGWHDRDRKHYRGHRKDRNRGRKHSWNNRKYSHKHSPSHTHIHKHVHVKGRDRW
ncbi:hypothetical protein D9615_002828 [Tricholomella constricta]|uniref:Uncharacterized protein n=1 Tax=Tricholomella constricta TaxID=117010 RepID=A0A8H5M6I9_9AGAR|nr:hypothetical protein D9615_002828 [Tricholomella constricta]